MALRDNICRRVDGLSVISSVRRNGRVAELRIVKFKFQANSFKFFGNCIIVNALELIKQTLFISLIEEHTIAVLFSTDKNHQLLHEAHSFHHEANNKQLPSFSLTFECIHEISFNIFLVSIVIAAQKWSM